MNVAPKIPMKHLFRQISLPEKYRAQLDRSRAILQNPGPLLADTRRMAYYSGALLLLGAQRAGLELRHSLSGQSKPLFSFLDRQFSQLPPVPLEQAALEAAAAVAAAQESGTSIVRSAAGAILSITRRIRSFPVRWQQP